MAADSPAVRMAGAHAGGMAAPQAPAQPLLRLAGIGKRFGAVQVLDDVSIDIAAGEIHCLLGENGAGKSTVCNIVFGTHRPSAGSMELAGAPYAPAGPAEALRDGIAMVHQHFSLVGDFSVVDNLLLGQARGVLKRRQCVEQLLELSARYDLQLDPQARIETLSVGERQRVEIVKCLVRNPRLLVLDEPTAVLLPEEIASLLEVCRKVAAQGCGVVLVTHKLAEIRQVAHRATVLRGGRIVARSMTPARDMDMLVRAMIDRDPATPKLDADIPVPKTQAQASTLQVRRPEPSLMLDGLEVVDSDGLRRLDNFTLTVDRGEIVAVAGVEGNGQSELGDVIAGMRKPSGGRMFIDGTELTGATPARITAAGVGIVPEDRHAVGCVLGMSVAENLFLNRLDGFRRFRLLDRQALYARAKELMTRFDVRAAGPHSPFSSLSGGNQQKAVLARELTLDPLRFLLAAQPTRGLDVGSVAAVYDHIRAACAGGVGALIVSSELDEVLTVAHRIVVIYRGRLMGQCKAEAVNRRQIGAWMAGQT